MSRAPMALGFCPTLFQPLASGDGLLVRVKPAAGRLTAAAARALGDAAAEFGNGLIDLTQRGNLQVRGLRPETVEPFTRLVLTLGLGAADPALEAIRNIACNPLGRDDPAAGFDVEATVQALESGLAARPALCALPAKFAFLVDGGGLLAPRGPGADVILQAGTRGEIFAGIAGSRRAAHILEAETAAAALALANAFLALAARQQDERPPRHMAELVARTGDRAIFAAAGLDPCHALPVPTRQNFAAGFLPYPGIERRGVFGFGIPFGQIEAPALIDLAALAATFGDGTIRATHWRSLLLPGVAIEDAETLVRAGTEAGLIADPADPRLRIAACVGRAGCRSGSVDARADAARLARLAPPRPGHFIHVSGCAKGCAHPYPAAATLVGREGRYDLVRHGRAADAPEAPGLTLEEAARRLQVLEESPA